MIVDFHTHIFPPEIARERARYLERDLWLGELYANPSAQLATAEELVDSMDANGVDVSVALNFGWSDPGLCAETNDYLLEAGRRFPGRIVPFCSVQPRVGEAAAREIERCARAGARGVGELMPDGQGYALDDAQVMGPVVEAVQGLGLILLSHASEPVGHAYSGKGKTTPDLLYRFIRQFPRLPVVLAHWGGGLPLYGLFRRVSEHLSSAWFDTAASPFLYRPEIYRHVGDILGPEKILFGSDYPLLAPARLLREIDGLNLPPRWREMIVGGNAEGLLRRPTPAAE